MSRLLVPPRREPLEPLAAPPSFSIIIAAYQAAGTIGTAVRSALEQTLPPHEVIVVDDGSTDDLEGALAPFLSRIVLIRQENRGAAAARNTAAAASSGDFVVVLDADDAYHPRRLEVLAELVRSRPDLDLVTTDARLVANGEGVGTFAAYTPFVVENQRTAIFETCFVGGWPAIRRSRLREIGGFDEELRMGEDWDCWLRAILAGAGAGMVDEPYYDYVLHPNTLSANRALSLWERVRLLEKARQNPALKPDELPSLETALRVHRSRAVEAEAQDALYGSAPRQRLLRRVFMPGIRMPARAAALATAVAPPLARRLVPEYHPAEERLGAEEPAA